MVPFFSLLRLLSKNLNFAIIISFDGVDIYLITLYGCFLITLLKSVFYYGDDFLFRSKDNLYTELK